MVKNSIKVYARVKRERNSKSKSNYYVLPKTEHEELIFDLTSEADPVLNKAHKYRFTKIFDQFSTQLDVFDVVAKPLINSVFNGFNGTIFAYGQTGSGKTYSITGSPDEYEDRGILPRTIEQIFEYVKTTTTQYSIYVSYLEIYNEIGYDLLNAKHRPTRLEELPRVALLEDANGEAHLRNLCILPVTNEQEAMRLLFLGDTNRTIAETPMNEYSSRSHCIFTIYVTVTSEKSERIRRSKLHLVDLAGSERVHKSKISGVTLTEAKHINLSLYYLEQVIIALSQTHRSHIPYRNSMMTYILRDSLSGNSLTAMLATLAITRKNFRETLTTCKFAQRVASICTEATINEEIDPQKEILFLREEVDELRRQLILLKGINTTEKLSEKQEENCKRIVSDYIKGCADEILAELGVEEMRFCLKLMRDNIYRARKSNQPQQSSENFNSALALKYNKIISEKDEEIATLKQLLDTTPQQVAVKNPDNNHRKSPEVNKVQSESHSTTDDKLYDQLKRIKSRDIEQLKLTLDQKYETAKDIVGTVQTCQDNIIKVRKKLNQQNTSDVNEKLRSNLLAQQDLYRDSLRRLESLMNETGFLKESLKQAEIQLERKFKCEKITVPETDWQDILNRSSDLPEDSLDLNDLGGLMNCSKINLATRPAKPKEQKTERKFKKRVSKTSCKTSSKSDVFADDFSESYNSNNISDSNLTCHYSSSEQSKVGTSYIDTDGKESVCTKTKNKYDSKGESKNFDKLKQRDDTSQFLDFMRTIPLTGDIEVDEEIFNFYRTKFSKKK